MGIARRHDSEGSRVPVRPEAAAKGYPWGEVARTRCWCWRRTCRCRCSRSSRFRPSFWAKWDDRGKLLLQLLHCWTWPNLLFWTLVPNHNVRYALPLSPGLMGLGVMGLSGRCFPLAATPKARAPALILDWSLAFLALLARREIVVRAKFVIPAAHREPQRRGRPPPNCASASPPGNRCTSSG